MAERCGGGEGPGSRVQCLPPPGVNIGGAGSYIYEKPSAEKPQVTGPIEVPVARTEERKASGPPKGPSKGGRGECGARGWGRRRQALTPPLPQPPASPRSPGSPTCVLAATRGSTSVSACAQPWLGRVPPRAPVSSSVPSPAEKVTSLGKDWHRPCLRCERCGKTLTPGGHAEVRGARPPTARGAGGGLRGPAGACGGAGRAQPETVGPEWQARGGL